MVKAYEDDLATLATSDLIPWESIENSVVMVTGATGLVGGAVANAILMRNSLIGASTKLICPGRNTETIVNKLGKSSDVTAVAWDASDPACKLPTSTDYIIHCAAPTQTRLFVEKPVEVMDAIVNGTRATLEVAKASGASMVYVSSMEVYGGTSSSEPIDETAGGPLDAMNLRSSYPQAKQLAETLCAAYATECGTRVCVARLAQTFGAGTPATDTRVFSYIAHACLEGNDIELATSGTKANMYVALPDAVSALLTLAVRGNPGTAYNVANEETFCSVRQMAEQAACFLSDGASKVRTGMDPQASGRYPVSTQMPLDTTRMRSLGWRPTQGLTQMYQRMVADWEVA